jgi:hypothetical protein
MLSDKEILDYLEAEAAKDKWPFPSLPFDLEVRGICITYRRGDSLRALWSAAIEAHATEVAKQRLNE